MKKKINQLKSIYPSCHAYDVQYKNKSQLEWCLRLRQDTRLFELVNYLVLFTCVISYKKWANEKKLTS